LLFNRIFRRAKVRDVPTLLAILLRTTTVASDAQLDTATSAADVVFAPDLKAFPITDFSRASEMMEIGKAHVRTVLGSWPRTAELKERR
jgi:hypothetical protein